jgi:hypothetical protein
MDDLRASVMALAIFRRMMDNSGDEYEHAQSFECHIKNKSKNIISHPFNMVDDGANAQSTKTHSSQLAYLITYLLAANIFYYIPA